MTEFSFRDDSYLKSLQAHVTEVNERGGVILDRTIFYATSGGQPGDCGLLRRENGEQIEIATALHPDGDKGLIVHVPNDEQPRPEIGEMLVCEIDWDRRHKLMRMHTALHILSVLFPYPVTGGSIGAEKGRLDFNMPEVPENIPDIQRQMNETVQAAHMVSDEWITEEELQAKPEMVKTMKVKPPMGQGRVRLVRIGQGDKTVDLQPCGGTHVANTSEIGPLRIGKIEKKGRENRRVNLHFAESFEI